MKVVCIDSLSGLVVTRDALKALRKVKCDDNQTFALRLHVFSCNNFILHSHSIKASLGCVRLTLFRNKNTWRDD